MRTFNLTKAFVLAACIAGAQTAKEPTVRIRKVEKVNGIEKVWDTTYTGSPGKDLEIADGMSSLDAHGKELTSFVTVTDDGSGGDKEYSFTFGDSASGRQEYRVIRSGEELTPEQKREIDEIRQSRKTAADNEPMGTVHEKVMVISNPGAGETSMRKVYVVRAIRISDAGPAETSRLAAANDELKVDELVCYPNPASDRVSLSFRLNQGDKASLAVFSPDGQEIMSEPINGSSGRFEKEIDLNGLPKGVYFLRIVQGDQAHTKKLIIE